MSDRTSTDDINSPAKDELALFVEDLEKTLRRRDYAEAISLVEHNAATAWFGLQPRRTLEILEILVAKVPSRGSMMHAVYRMLTAPSSGKFDDHEFLSMVDTNDSTQMFILSILRMGDFRMHGRNVEALEQGDNVEHYLGTMNPLLGSQDGWALHTSVQIGVTAMLAGHFTRALTAFTQAQMHTPIRKYAFLKRDALAKAALIHACFGNASTAKALIERMERVPRTSSWAESHIDAHRDFAKILTLAATPEEALDQLESISLEDTGELWPFYVVAIHRTMEAAGHHDELDHRLEMLDTMPFPAVDRDGFSGSIIPLKRALLAMQSGRGTDAQALLDRADPRIPYTQLFQAAGHVYAGRTQQAIQEAIRLRCETRGFRSLEVRRLAVVAAGQYQAEDTNAAIDTLRKAAELPRGLKPAEVALFSPETRELANKHIATWPDDNGEPSRFLTGLPKPGRALTERELEIVGYLAEGHTRAQAADKMYVSVNTLKTQLKSIYRKLEVSSAADAVLGAQRRGLI